jgi:hypothetical protein
MACEICLKEVPVSEANNNEASDYVRHYFGMKCYAIWKQQVVNVQIRRNQVMNVVRKRTNKIRGDDMVKRKYRKEEVSPDETQDDADMEFPNESHKIITTDKWRNEWDSSGEFSDMDFRLVDDD